MTFGLHQLLLCMTAGSVTHSQLCILPKIQMVNKVIEENQENLSNPKCVHMSVCQGSVKVT